MSIGELDTDLESVRSRIERQRSDVGKHVDFMFCMLLVVQYFAIVLMAQWISPRTWIGSSDYLHVHVGMAFAFGAVLSAFPILLVMTSPGARLNRYVIAVAQMLNSALLIHVTGGRIESHFHVFGSLAFLSLYREWQVLAVATVVVAVDHAARGVWWPKSIFGTDVGTNFRWIEHAVWVIFEDVVLILGCEFWRRDMKEKAEQAEQLVQISGEAKRLAEQDAAHARELAEYALREMGTMREALEEHSILSVADRSGKIIDVNGGFIRISGYNRAELLGQDHRILNSGHHPKEFWVGVWRQISSGSAWRGEVCNRRKDGSLYWVDSTIVPYQGEDGTIQKYVSIRFDITAQKNAEAHLLVAQAKADSANRAKSEFLANMSHEIRTPMTAIMGFTELLASEADSSADKRTEDYVAIIQRNGEHLMEILNDILDISKIEAGRMTVESVAVDPRHLIQDVLSLMRVKAVAKGIALSAIFETPIPSPIYSDPVRLRQILVNLVGNAIKFTELGSVRMSVGFNRSSNTLSIAVEDSGIGMTSRQVEHLFEAFQQADQSTTRRFGGSGLGLNISKRLAEMLGGDITADSQYGKGSVFTVTVGAGDTSASSWDGTPSADAVISTSNAKSLTQTSSGKSEPEKVLEGLRVLLVEDGPDNQRLIGHILRKAGAMVDVVENGRLAVEALTIDGSLAGDLLSPPPFHLILCDMQMPVMDGYATAKLLREKGLRVPIVALTAHNMAGDLEKCLRHGCDAHASKPIERSKLIDICRTYGRKAPISLLPPQLMGGQPVQC